MINRILASVCISLLILLLNNSCRAEKFKPDRTVLYKTVGEHQLYLHIFNPQEHSIKDKRPAIIFFFGGDWVSGTPAQFYPHCKYLASRGMVAISAEYRIKNKHGTTPFECVKDGKSAIRWVRTHASELGIDPYRIAAGGASAGGQVAAAAGTLKAFEESSEDLSISSRPDALVLIYPVFDNGPDGYGYERVKERWKEFSPMHNIDNRTPPTIIFLGTKDIYVPVNTVKKYKSLMEKSGVRCDLYLYEGQPHGFCNHPSYKGNSTEFFNKVCIEMEGFLRSLGFLGRTAE